MPSSSRRTNWARIDPRAPLRALREQIAILHLDVMTMILPAKAEQNARQWLSRLASNLDDEAALDATNEAIVLAVDLETFTPSHSGSTALERLARRRTLNREQDVAFRALKQARLTVFVLDGSKGDDLYSATDLATRERLTVLDDQLPSSVLGVPMMARLCDLGEGIVAPVSVVTPLHPDGVALALDFAKPGKGIANPHRCAAAVYRHVVRHGNPKIEGVNVVPDLDDDDPDDAPTALDQLAARLVIPGSEGAGTRLKNMTPEILDEARRVVSIDTIFEALFKTIASPIRGAPQVAAIYRRFAEVQIEALHLRALAGSGLDRTPLDTLSQAIDRAIALEDYPGEARELFREIRRVVTAVKPQANQENLTRVIERIRGLRAKTIDQGCTEEEAMAAAAKVAEMLDRYGLSLGEIDLRQQTCQGFGIDSTRKRSGPVDHCLPAVARFCDCRAWHEKAPNGTIRSVFFGLPADVEAARYLYERVAMAFDTETARFQAGSLYDDLFGPARREATASFQIGLARGITDRLDMLKTKRDATAVRASGQDIVPVKASVVEDELAKLGLSFTSKPGGQRRMIRPEAYHAGQAAGLQFEAQSELE